MWTLKREVQTANYEHIQNGARPWEIIWVEKNKTKGIGVIETIYIMFTNLKLGLPFPYNYKQFKKFSKEYREDFEANFKFEGLLHLISELNSGLGYFLEMVCLPMDFFSRNNIELPGDDCYCSNCLANVKKYLHKFIRSRGNGLNKYKRYIPSMIRFWEGKVDNRILNEYIKKSKVKIMVSPTVKSTSASDRPTCTTTESNYSLAVEQSAPTDGDTSEQVVWDTCTLKQTEVHRITEAKQRNVFDFLNDILISNNANKLTQSDCSTETSLDSFAGTEVFQDLFQEHFTEFDLAAFNSFVESINTEDGIPFYISS